MFMVWFTCFKIYLLYTKLSMGDLTNNFSAKEFACRCGCGFQDINLGLVDILQNVRDNYPHPLIITSGFRCPEHNRNVGGSPESSHLKGLAVDIACPDSTSRYILLRTLVVYFSRICIAKNFIHVDIDYDKTTGVMWTYPAKKA